ncbi:MAG: PD-(D/E)XK nuclease family protein [Acidobacteriota bacterium]|nr:PD-(D/E)XK nuclease family protein [Acidobacteriota bacterium]
MSGEAIRNEDLTREIAAMFEVMEPAVAAASLAVQVMEDRVRGGRDRRTAARFSAVDLAVQRELDLSRIFGHLLDPREAHAQGDAFLALLLEELRLAPSKCLLELAEFRSPPAAGSTITLEHGTGDGRIDILIELGDGRRIAIENKPWAWDQERQAERYLRYLRELAAKSGSGDESFLLLYWSGDADDPEWRDGFDERLKSRCINMPYGETGEHPSVEGWLRRCAVACEAPRVRSFLTDLVRYVEREFQR